MLQTVVFCILRVQGIKEKKLREGNVEKSGRDRGNINIVLEKLSRFGKTELIGKNERKRHGDQSTSRTALDFWGPPSPSRLLHIKPTRKV